MTWTDLFAVIILSTGVLAALMAAIILPAIGLAYLAGWLP